MKFAKPVFVIAMDNEAAAVAAHLEDVRESARYGRRVLSGAYRGVPVAAVVTGVGKSNAAAGAQLALVLGADVLVNAGVAGGLLPTMGVAEVYRVRAAVQYDFDLAAVNGTKVGTLNECAERELPLLAVGARPDALLGTGDRFNDSEADYRFLVDDVKAALRDMEGAAIAHVARRAGVPCVSFKSVSDVHGSGSTVGQYRDNLGKALAALSAEVPAVLDELLF
ncbi:MAG: 5'-methylthioadenosine/S-adenosylhomocysteine nucleosidase [Kiritimatiellia bacterium]